MTLFHPTDSSTHTIPVVAGVHSTAELDAACDAFLQAREAEDVANRSLEEHEENENPDFTHEEMGRYCIEEARLNLAAVEAEWARSFADHRMTALILAAFPINPVYSRGEFTIVASPHDAPQVIDNRPR